MQISLERNLWRKAKDIDYQVRVLRGLNVCISLTDDSDMHFFCFEITFHSSYRGSNAHSDFGIQNCFPVL